ncbi:lipase family protein [Pseudomonas sp. PB120]|uniref:lipase family protein n=1 Tax=Pseudomonas sp. PB120 TaxID=2494700 RepID=UPI0012FD206E|nr:lipase family protein [Pseudomonas sp. PB120]MVV52163.1 lipase family protein [Pseudomonas sp. PB120]
MTSLEKELESGLSSRILTCPVQGRSSSFQLVDEFGSGEPYAGLAYTAIDSEGQKYSGYLDITGTAKITNHFAGPVALTFDQKYQGTEKLYKDLITRPHYALEITELQVRAEQTRFLNQNSTRTRENPAQACADEYFQVEVRHLVEHASHLPPEVYRHFPHTAGAAKIMGKHGALGVALLPMQHTVLEVRPLRALRPMLSTAPEFCALNLYQLALMATLSYCPFGQKPDEHPVTTKTVSFPLQPSVGNWYGDALAKFEELGKVDSAQKAAYYPLYEDVPYSKRLEIVPFDPDLYDANKPGRKDDQEHPANIHFLDDSTLGEKATDTQAFITHNNELILIAVRGTYELIADGLRDADAFQVPFEDTDSKVHRGFYEAAQKAYDFVVKYFDKFYAGQKLIICGHSLGGAVALLLSEMLRRRSEDYNIQLYTYGAPRAGDATFTKGAASLVHYRMVNHNDPVPSVPGTWMNTKAGVFATGAALTFVNVPAGLSVFLAGITNWTGEPYEHHGKLYHALPVQFGRKEMSMILWEPGCDTITQHAACTVALQQQHGLPDRPTLVTQFLKAGNHSMVGGYIPAAWVTLLRWQEALKSKRSIVTEREFEWIEGALQRIILQLRSRRKELLNSTSRAAKEAIETTIPALNLEVDKVQATRDRLARLWGQRVSDKNVYGLLAEQPEHLAENLLRWQLHPENQVEEQLAMAPKTTNDDELMASIYGHAPGAPYTLDIDSIT